MRLLLFFVSFIFSFIFYSFYLLTKWKNFLWDETFYNLKIESLSSNLLIESVFFLVIWFIFIIYFTSYKENKMQNFYNKILYILYYFLLITPFYLGFLNPNFIIFIFIIIFIFWDLIFNYISNLKYFIHEKVKLRYFWLILNYLVFISSLLYLFIVEFSYYIILIIIYSIVFNYFIHKKYSNYISLFLSILWCLMLIYFLFLKIKEFYIVLF